MGTTAARRREKLRRRAQGSASGSHLEEEEGTVHLGEGTVRRKIARILRRRTAPEHRDPGSEEAGRGSLAGAGRTGTRLGSEGSLGTTVRLRGVRWS